MYKEISDNIEVNVDNKGNVTLRSIDMTNITARYFFMNKGEAINLVKHLVKEMSE